MDAFSQTFDGSQWQQQLDSINHTQGREQWRSNPEPLKQSSCESFPNNPANSGSDMGSGQGYSSQLSAQSNAIFSSSTNPSSAQKPKTRARRGQATDPHSIAERLRRERIADRMKALQDLVPNSNKVDRAAMLDDIIEYVRFLQLQVKVLGMSDLDDKTLKSMTAFLESMPEEVLAAAQDSTGLNGQQRDLTERQVALLMEQDIVSAMHYLQTKGLCLLPISVASSIFKQRGGGGGDDSVPTTSMSDNDGFQQRAPDDARMQYNDVQMRYDDDGYNDDGDNDDEDHS